MNPTSESASQPVPQMNMESKLPKRRLVLAWDMHYNCNYRCPYCFYTSAGWAELAKKNTYKSPQEWGEVWERMHARHGSCQLRITAGEPFTYPGFVEVIATITRWHDVQVTTNGSRTDSLHKFVTAVDPAHAELDCTFHPLNTDFDLFLNNVLLLRKHGFTANVCYLAYPAQLAGMPDFKRRFAQNGVHMNLAMYWGAYQAKDYPFAYSSEERLLIKEVIGQEIGPETVNLEPIPVRGKICGAGQRYAVVQADGKIYRCGQLCHEDQSIASIFAPEVKLLETGRPCPVDYCRCKEFQSAWEDDEKKMMLQENRLQPVDAQKLALGTMP